MYALKLTMAHIETNQAQSLTFINCAVRYLEKQSLRNHHDKCCSLSTFIRICVHFIALGATTTFHPVTQDQKYYFYRMLSTGIGMTSI